MTPLSGYSNSENAMNRAVWSNFLSLSGLLGFIYLTPRKAEREYCPLDWQRVGQFRAAEDMRYLGTPHSRAAHGASREAGGPREGAWESSI